MAKFGEGDPRWLVKDLGNQGTNVNGWHWVERDAMEWSKQRLAELFTGLEPLKGAQFKITGVDSVTGEAIINNRKQKIIPSYELEIKFNWEGTVDVKEVKGKIHLPYVADENHDEDPEIKFISATDDDASAQLKQTFLQGEGKKEVTRLIGDFVKELRAGGPALSNSQPSTEQAASTAKPKLSSADPNQLPTATSTIAATPAKTAKGSGQSLKIKEQFYCRALDIYECFTNPARVMGFTQSPAMIEPKVGGSFSWFGGSVQGVFTELEPGQKISMDWRFSSWEDGCTSKVVITLDEPEPGHTHLTLSQTGIPSADKYGAEDVLSTTEKGWKVQVFQRIRQVFGYGLGL